MNAGSEVRHFRIHGRVQGVGYRAFVWRLASTLGLRGWVRNRHDGTVEAVLEGAPETLDHAKEQLRQGPRLSVVERVEVSEETAEGPFAGFDVRYDW